MGAVSATFRSDPGGAQNRLATNSEVPGETERDRPAVFLMTDSFEAGGSERQFITLARALDPRTFEVRLGCLRRSGLFAQEIDEAMEFNLGGSFLSLQAQRARWALGRELRARAAAIAHSFDFYSNLMLIPAARLARVPVVIGSHRQLGDLLTPLQRRVQSAMFRLCDRVVCNSEAAADRLIESGLPQGKVVIIPNALPDEFFASPKPAMPKVPGVVRVGLIARMNTRIKGHEVLLRAVARLAPRFPNVEFFLIGDGPLRPDLERTAAALGVSQRVRFLGERRDIPALLASIDISVLPSSSESLSNAILESMAAGVPVIATDVGGNPELVRDRETGLLFPAGDEDKFIEFMERMIGQPELRTEYGQRAQHVVRDEFSLERIRRRYVQLYAELLADKGWQPQTRHSRLAVTAHGSQPMQVAIVAPSSRWIGGQGVQANALVRHWRDDPAVKAHLIPIDPEFPRWLRWAERIPYVRTLVRTPFYLAALWRGMKDAEIVHIFSASYWSLLLAPAPALLVAKLRRKATLINYHSGEAGDHLRRWRTAVPILRRADRLVVPSAYLADVFREFGLQAEVVPNTVDLHQFTFRPRQPLHPNLICTRGFHPYYSVDLVVRAFAQVKKGLPEAHLVLVGKGTTERAIRALLRELDLADVDFTGPVAHRDIGRFYDQSDIFINASWLDNMPLSILEAFACGTPVVSTAPEGIRYLVEHERTGLLCTPGDWQALAENVLRLVRDPDLAERIVRNAYEEARRYRWEVVRGQWLAAYRASQDPHVTVADEARGLGMAPFVADQKPPAGPEASERDATRSPSY